jgi:hypothetical protein
MKQAKPKGLMGAAIAMKLGEKPKAAPVKQTPKTVVKKGK